MENIVSARRLRKSVLRNIDAKSIDINKEIGVDLEKYLNKNTSNNIFTYILTGDKDSFQLISDTTSIIIPTTRFGKTEYTIYTPELLKEKQNIEIIKEPEKINSSYKNLNFTISILNKTN